MYAQYKSNPENVDATWREFFKQVDKGSNPGSAFKLPTRTSKVCEYLIYYEIL